MNDQEDVLTLYGKIITDKTQTAFRVRTAADGSCWLEVERQGAIDGFPRNLFFSAEEAQAYVDEWPNVLM